MLLSKKELCKLPTLTSSRLRGYYPDGIKGVYSKPTGDFVQTYVTIVRIWIRTILQVYVFESLAFPRSYLWLDLWTFLMAVLRCFGPIHPRLPSLFSLSFSLSPFPLPYAPLPLSLLKALVEIYILYSKY